jgi:uncharacterized protein
MSLSPHTHSADDVVRLLGLEPLPHEGGWFRRTTESPIEIPTADLPRSYVAGTARLAYSAIYALITPKGFSALHRLTADEIWCFHAGDSLESLRLPKSGPGEWVRLGPDVAKGERLQDVVRGGVWQGTRLVSGGRWSLVSCVVVPEFRWQDFELADRAVLQAAHPGRTDEIAALTRR